MPYKFDVFISYSRRSRIEEWMKRFFVEELEFQLDQEFPVGKPRIFWDRTGIEPGDRWSDVLKEALQQSSCLLAIWSTSYFKSKWCAAEFLTFLERASVGEIQPQRVIIPLQWNDGDYYPLAAKEFHYCPFERYTSLIRDTAIYSDFVEAVKQLARTLKCAIDQAPNFQNWPVKEPADIDTLVKENPDEARRFYNFEPISISNPSKLAP